MNLKRKLIFNLILSMLLLMFWAENTQASSLFDNLTVRATNVFSMETLGASLEERFEVPVTIDGVEYNITYEITDITNNYVKVYDCVTTITGDLVLPSSVMYEGIKYTVTEIGSSLFSGCNSLISVTLPSSINEIELRPDGLSGIFVQESNPFDSESLEKIIVDSNSKFFESENGILYNKGKTKLIKFPQSKQDTEFNIPSAVISIEEGAINNCHNLTNISIPNSVETIRTNGIASCNGLTNITIPEGVKSLSSGVLTDCENLKTINISSTVESISYGAVVLFDDYGIFRGSNNLENIIVDSNSAFFESENGILYDKGKTCILRYPPAKTETAYNIAIGATRIETGAFTGCSNLTEVVIPEGITDMGIYTFYNCSGLTKITIPKGVTEIESDVFYGCSSLSNVTIPEGVTRIGSEAFYNCSSLSNVTIPEGVTNIEEYTFNGCSGLTEIIIPKGVTSIGSYGLSGCSGLTGITIPEGITSIESGTFYNCSGLTEITIPEGVTTIGSYAFRGCSGLTEITIPEGVTSIENYTFYNCSGLTEITIPEGVTNIGNYAFNGCSGLTELIIPSGITNIGNYTFSNCRNLTDIWVYIDDENTEKTSWGTSVFSKYNGKPTIYGCGNSSTATYASGNSIDFVPFAELVYEYNNTNYTATVKNDESYEGALTGKLAIPSQVKYNGKTYTVTSIAYRAFSDCIGLTGMVIPNNVTKIGSSAFSGCTGLTSVIIPEELIDIEMYTFNNCIGLTEITIPNAVTKIGVGAFGNCSALTSIKVEDGNTYFCSINGVLFNKDGNTIIKYPEGKDGINYTIPEGVTGIGDMAFSGSVNLTSIEIPKEIISIGKYVFENCLKLQEVIFEKTTGLISLNTGIFNGCESLTKIKIPETIEIIEADAFKACTSLTEIEIPANVREVKEMAFVHCSNLHEVFVYGKETNFITGNYGILGTFNVFEYCAEDLTIYGYKNSSVQTYASNPDGNDETQDTIKFEAFKGTISYNLDGGTNSSDNLNYYYWGEETIIANPSKKGYRFVGWTGSNGNTPQTGVIIETESTENKTYIANWAINQYTITYNLNGGSEVAANPTEYTVETENFTLSNPIKVGYTFTGWTGSNGTTAKEEVEIAKGTTGNLNYTANWRANTDTKYIVEHYQQNVIGEEYTKADTEIKYGTTGEITEAEAINYDGFECQEIAQATIAGDGSTVIKVYYTRNEYTLTYKVDGVQYGIIESYKYGASISIREAPSKTGYTFSGWNGFVTTMPATNVEITGTFDINTYKYIVEYYYEGIKDESKTEEKTAEYQEVINNYPDKVVIGYKLEKIENLPLTISDIEEDNVIKIFYVHREVTHITLEGEIKTEYTAFETFDKTGLMVKAVYDNGEEKIVEDYDIEPSRPLEVTDTKVIISYTEREKTKQIEQEIVVKKILGKENPAYIESLEKLRLDGAKQITYYEGLKLKDISLLYPWEWNEAETELFANGEGIPYKVTYKSKNPNYEDVENEASILVKVEKANPKYDLPEEIEAEEGIALEELNDKLPKGYRFIDSEGTQVEGIGYKEYKVIYIPEDTDNYNTVENIPIIIRVVKRNIPITEITLAPILRIIKSGKAKLKADIKSPEATEVELIWTSSNEEIVTVDKYGNIEAKEIGKAVITAETVNGEHKAECEIEVVEILYSVIQEGEEICIREINPNTSKKVFESKFPTQYEMVIYDQEGRKIDEEEIIGTGYKLELYEGENKKVKDIELVVKGDVTGEGEAENIDLARIIYHIIGKQELNVAYQKAADINGDKEIDGRDMTHLIYHIINKKGFEWEN